MSTISNPAPVPNRGGDVPAWLILLLATSCGLIVANLYYAQPVIGPISIEFGLPSYSAGLIVTLTQIGYGLGLLFIVPLGDLLENRRLVLSLLSVDLLALILAANCSSGAVFLAIAFLIGLSSVAIQVLVPYAAHLAPEHIRGKVVGNVMSGLLLGIMLARPVSSLITDFFSWRAVYASSAVLMLGLMVLLRLALPPRRPAHSLRYAALIHSMVDIVRTTPILRRRAVYQACMFGAFSLFWTVAPLHLARNFGLQQRSIALFALAGVAGALVAPFAGRYADRGRTRQGTAMAIGVGLVSLLGAHWIGTSSSYALGLLTLAAIGLDMGVSANLVLGQRAIYALAPQLRGRLNALYMATFFAGGALGSALGGWAFASGGWQLASWIGVAFIAAALLYFLSERAPQSS